MMVSMAAGGGSANAGRGDEFCTNLSIYRWYVAAKVEAYMPRKQQQRRRINDRATIRSIDRDLFRHRRRHCY
jgi:hypothetical protein